MRSFTNLIYPKSEFILLSILLLISLLFWQSILLYPVKFLSIIFHEIGHAISAVISGGKIISISITNDLGGHSRTEGGVQFLIAISGYLSSLFFGAILFFSGYNKKHALIISSIISALLLVFAANYIRTTEGILFSLIFVIFFFAAPRIMDFEYYSIVQKFIGLISSFYVIFDLRLDIFSGGYYLSDAFYLYQLTGMPEYFWGIIWTLISLSVIFFELRLLIRKAIRGENGKDLSQNSK